MNASKKVVIESSIKEAEALCRAIRSYNPPQEDEMVIIMLYSRIKRKIEEAMRSELS